MIVFFFSGHGSKGGFCPYDINTFGQNQLSYDEIHSILLKCKASKRIVIADACMSGGIRKKRLFTTKYPNNFIMFLSSRTDEYSVETSRMKHGFFTAYLERGLRGGADTNRDRIITAKEIYTFVSNGFSKSNKHGQHPVIWGNFDDNFAFLKW